MIRLLATLLLLTPPAFADYAKEFLEFQKQLHKGAKKDFATFQTFYKKTSKDDLFVEWLSAYGMGLQAFTPEGSLPFNPMIQMLVFANNEVYCWPGIDSPRNDETGALKELRLEGENVSWIVPAVEFQILGGSQVAMRTHPRRCPSGFLRMTMVYEKITYVRDFFMPRFPTSLPVAEFSPILSLDDKVLRLKDPRLYELSQVFGQRISNSQLYVTVSNPTGNGLLDSINGPVSEVKERWAYGVTQLPIDVRLEYWIRSPAEYGPWTLLLHFQKLVHSSEQESSSSSSK